MVKKIIRRLLNKKGQAPLEETPAEKYLSAGLLILLIILIVVMIYLIYHYLIKDGQFINVIGKLFRGY